MAEITPFYEDELITLYNCRCEDFMATCRDKEFELAIVDPPYGIGDFSQSDSTQHVNWNNNIPDKLYFNELIRISERRIIWGANYYNCFENGNGALIWYKNIGHPSMSHCEIASISHQQKIDYIHINWSGGIRASQNDFCHPCQKPVQLYRYCLQNYAKPGWTIFDSHAGSCSLAIACHDLGFKLTACEIDIDYLTAAVNRIKNYLKEPKWFKPVTHSEQMSII